MKDDMNLLILSAGSRNNVVTYFKEAFLGKGKIIAADCSPYAPALYEADAHELVPRIDAPDYLEKVLAICTAHRVKAVLSLIDPELSLLALHEAAFKARGARVLVSPYDVTERCLDKYAMFEFLKAQGFHTPKSFVDLADFKAAVAAGEIGFPVFLKPRTGSASMSISKVGSMEQMEFLFPREEDLMIQEYMEGEEYGADVYVDLITKEPVSMFLKKKLKMRAGETDKAVSVVDAKVFALLERLVAVSGFSGVIDVDLFRRGDTFYVSEVNPRFGGGYPHAKACGLDFPKMILRNLMGEVNEREIGGYDSGVVMMKFNDIRIIRE